jgi:hypothetical protein
MELTLSVFLSQLLSQSPILLAYLVGVILAVVFRRRCPLPARLTLAAMLLLLLSTLVQLFVFAYLMQARLDRGWSIEQSGWFMAVNGLIGTLIRVAAFGLLLTAVFIGRKRAQQPTAIDAPQLPESASREPIEQGITTRPNF